jgi:hypothetical protein
MLAMLKELEGTVDGNFGALWPSTRRKPTRFSLAMR